jgi:hemerythrin-like domain-containing protein
MLTTTYTLVALSVEQTSVRASLQSLRKLLHENFLRHSTLSCAQVAHVCEALRRIYDTCHWRKVETFLVPAVRRATGSADRLLQELDEFSLAAADAMGTITERFHGIALDSAALVSQFCGLVDAFCDSMLARLEREERELFPLARAVVCGEAWFSIANQMLVFDAQLQESRPAQRSAVHRHAGAHARREREPQRADRASHSH